MKKCSTLVFPLSFLLITLLLSCNSEEAPIPLSSCPEGDTYAIDYRTALLEYGYIWLSESDGDVGYEEELSTQLSPTAFQLLDFPGACEESYTVSMATIPFQATNSAAEVARSFVINEVAAVPGGSLVDRGANITPSVTSVIGRSIEILDAPPLADAQLLTRTTSSAGQEFNLVRQDRYRSNDSIVILDMNSAQSLSGAGFLLLRLLHTQEVVGMYLDFSAGYPAELDFSAFTPMERRTLNIDWPVSSFDHLLALSYVDNLSRQQQIYLGTGYGSNSLTINLPSDADGLFVVTASWSTGAEFEVQYVYDQWPEEIVFAPIVAGQIDDYRYPEIDIDVELADIVMLEGEVRNTQQNEFCSRQYIGPVTGGEQTLRLPDLSPVFINLGGSLPSLYERAYAEGSQLSFLHYPAMQGSFRWYLTNIYNKGFNSGNWLETLEYERISIEL